MKIDEEMFITLLKNNLRYLRLTYGLTQTEMAKLIDKTPTAISNYEAGIREPSAVDLGIIANHFGITVEQLIFNDLRFDKGQVIAIDKPNSMSMLKDLLVSERIIPKDYDLTSDEYETIMQFIENNKFIWYKEK